MTSLIRESLTSSDIIGGDLIQTLHLFTLIFQMDICNRGNSFTLTNRLLYFYRWYMTGRDNQCWSLISTKKRRSSLKRWELPPVHDVQKAIYIIYIIFSMFCSKCFGSRYALSRPLYGSRVGLDMEVSSIGCVKKPSRPFFPSRSYLYGKEYLPWLPTTWLPTALYSGASPPVSRVHRYRGR